MGFGKNQEQRKSCERSDAAEIQSNVWIDGGTGSIEDNWEKMKEILLDILNSDIGKM
jgi:hypothetical protein